VKDVFQATVFSKITYCLPAWFGFCTAADSCVAVLSKVSGLPVICHPYAPLLRISRTLCSIKFFVVIIISCQIDWMYFIILEKKPSQ